MSQQKVSKKVMKNAVAWVELPASDLKRAKKFYEQIFGIEMININIETDTNLKMCMFPVEEGGVGGALCQHEFYKPSHEGALVYFSGEPDLQPILDRVEPSGGKVLQSKTQISDEYGFMAVFEDTEGNRVALHSMK